MALIAFASEPGFAKKKKNFFFYINCTSENLNIKHCYALVKSSQYCPSDPSGWVGKTKMLLCIHSVVKCTQNKCSFSLIFWIHHRCHRTLVDGVFTSIPFGIHLFFFEFCEFPSVMDDHKKLPYKQESQANENDSSNDTSNNGDYVGATGTFWILHHMYMNLRVCIDRVGKVEPAVIGVLLFAVCERIGLSWLR